MIDSYTFLVFLHVVLFAYWLGPDWGVYLTSPAIWKAELPVEERLRRARLVVQMAQISRNSLILLLPIGLTMAAMLGLSVVTGPWLVLAWVIAIAWVAASLLIYHNRDSRLTPYLVAFDQGLRWVLMLSFIPIGIYAFVTMEIIAAQWLALKLVLFGVLLGNSMQQRGIALKWVSALRDIEAGKEPEAAERVFEQTARRSQLNAYLTWSTSIAIAFLGITKIHFF